MAYETGVASSIEDLVSKLFTFATGEGWTQDELDLTANYGTLHRGNVYVSFRWDTSPSTDLAVYQSLGWTAAQEPHEQDDDSGQGDTTTPINSGRRCNFESSGPYTSYFFFASDSAPHYIYCVVQVSSGIYRHAFGFGDLDKSNDWTGGEFAYAHYWDQLDSNIDDPSRGAHSFLLDNACTSIAVVGTVHAEDLPAQGVDEKWLVSFKGSAGGTDTAGETRRICIGTARGGGWTSALAWIPVSQVNAYKAFIPIEVWYKDTTTSPDTIYKLGRMPGIVIVNMKSLSPGDEITIGSDTYTVFPWVRKQKLEANTQESWNAGVGYLKLV